MRRAPRNRVDPRGRTPAPGLKPTRPGPSSSPPVTLLRQLHGSAGNQAVAGLLRRKSSGASGPRIPPVVQEVLRSSGQPLEPEVRQEFERQFARDLGGVRVHADALAARSAEALGALAYTARSDHVVFGAGRYAPTSSAGRQLLAHELAHVVQQRAAGLHPEAELVLGEPADAAEAEADRATAAVTSGGGSPTGLSAHSPDTIARACGSVAIGRPPGCGVGNHTFVPGPVFRFVSTCDDFATGQEAALVGLATGLPSTATFEVHGFASVDGDADFNEQLSCARTNKAVSVLTGAGAIPASRITSTANHGPTPGPAADRRSVVILTTVPAPVVTPTVPVPAGRTLPTGPFLDLQIACVTDADGCLNPATIPTLDTNCRTTTNYAGIPLVEADLVCATPGLGIAQSLDRAYPGWRGLIPPCPCSRAAADSAANFSRDINPFLGRFHPGADVCFRSDAVASAPGTEHRQQCCYTRGGLLIVVGAGAGTPDAWEGFWNHQRIDVQPFNELGSAIYNRFWIPDPGTGCPGTDPCVNRCEQIFDQCRGDGARCLAARNTCLSTCGP